MFDTIHVQAQVSDETHLTSVVIQLTDLNSIPVQSSYSIPITGKSISVDYKYQINEYRLPSGFYYLSILANDGSNTHQGVKKIYITESPTVKTGYYITTGLSPKTISRYDTTLALQNSVHLNTGFNGMAYGGYYHQLYINGNASQSLTAIDPTVNDQQKWSSLYNVNDAFTCISSDGTYPYVGYYSGKVRTFTSAGNNGVTYVNSNNNLYPKYFTTTGTYGVGIYKDKTGGGDKLICFTKNTGIAFNSNFTPCSVTDVFEHTQDEFYVLGNDGSNQAVLYLYSASGNVFNGPLSLPAGTLVAAAQADSDFILFALSNGTIYGYRYSTNNTLILTSQQAQKLFYHPKLAELNVSYKNFLYTYRLSTNYSLNLVNTRALTDTIVDFEVITNK
jgi:hypothetical protein